MNEKEIRLYISLIYIGVAVSVLLLLIDFRLKADTVKLLRGDNGDGAVPGDKVSNWDHIRYDHPHVRSVPNSRFASGVETAVTDQEIPETEAASGELDDRAGDPEFQEDDQPV